MKNMLEKGGCGKGSPKKRLQQRWNEKYQPSRTQCKYSKKNREKRTIIIKNQAYHWECMKLWLVFMPKCEMEFFKTNHLLKLEETQEKWKTTCETMPKNTTKFPIKIAKVNAILLLVFSLSFFVCEIDDLKAHIHTHYAAHGNEIFWLGCLLCRKEHCLDSMQVKFMMYSFSQTLIEWSLLLQYE